MDTEPQARQTNCFMRPIASIRPIFVSLVAALILVVGCKRPPTSGDVRGTVTLDGKALEDGTIRFTPIDGKGGTAGGMIKDGQFAFSAPIAKHRVEISATRMTGGRTTPADRHSDAVEAVVDLIPEKYNTQSELTLDVKGGLNEPRFDLKSQ
jgi:hypothetical protein